MSKEIYISTTPHETRLAIVEDERLAEIYFERENEYTLAGSIYNGKVTRVLPGMQSSFVDIGLERDAFLYVTDFMEEQGDAADFDGGEGSRRREGAVPREGSGPREGAGRDNDRRSRDRGRNRDRGEAPTATAPAGETQSFDEPIAPHLVERTPAAAADNIAALDESGSRRWRGRRGRRRGRGNREGAPETQATPLPAAEHENERYGAGNEETFLFEGSSEMLDEPESADLELQASSDVGEPSPEYLRTRQERENRRLERLRERGGVPREPDAPPEDRRPPVAVPGSIAPLTSLPGESLRKYRDPAEVAAEDAARRAAEPQRPVESLPAPSASSIEIQGWDGGFVLPGETLSRRRGSAGHSDPGPAAPAPSAVNSLSVAESFASSEPAFGVRETHIAPTPIPDVESIATAEAPEETAGLTQHPAHADESVAVDAPFLSGEAGAEPSEYEPAEGEAVSLGDTGTRDLRRLARRDAEREVPEPQTTSSTSFAAASDAPSSDPETFAALPDPTTYDLATEAPATHEITHIESSGEMLDAMPAEPANVGVDAVTPVLEHVEIQPDHAFTDTPPAANPLAEEPSHIAAESAPQAGMAWVPGNPVEVDDEEDAVPQVHAYGDGDLSEEVLDGDEFEYDVAMIPSEEDELDEYEEEEMDEDTGDFAPSILETSTDADEPAGDEDEEIDASGGFSVSDFGGEPGEDQSEAEGIAEPATGQPRPRRDGRRGNRDGERRGGGFRGGAGAVGDRGRGNRRHSVQAMDLPAINELLKPGQEVLVQIAKEPIAKKGARITSHIALPGRFLVFMPTVNHTGVSRKIWSDEERRRLKTILLSEKGDAQGGFIVRTAAEGASEEELRNDLRFLIQLWQDIKQRSETSKAPALIYHDLSLIERILRDQVTDTFSAIWVDSESEYERVLRFLQRFQPSLVRRVKLYTKETPLFEHFGVTPEIDKALKSKVWLKSGGSIVINQTEALVAIDINTGKYVGKTARLEDTIVKTNLDAIPEIVRQIRLRDLGGIIVIDFIDMDERKNRARVLQALEDELRADRAPSKVLPFNDFGLVIMTRKRVKQSLERTLCMPDPITEGTGMIKSPITVANEIYIEMRKMHRHLEGKDVMLRVHPEVVKTLKAAGGKRLQELEEMTRKTILVKSDPALNPEQFDIH